MAGPKESVFEGKTLDDAVRMGLNALGLSRAEVMITVLDEGSGGFLGLGARPPSPAAVPWRSCSVWTQSLCASDPGELVRLRVRPSKS